MKEEKVYGKFTLLRENKLEDKMKNKKVIKWKCDICGRVIESLNQNQLDSWSHNHMKTHNNGGKKNE